MNDFNFEGRVGVVTGGASGVGRGLAEAMRDRGMKVMIADLDATAGQAAARALGAAFRQVDVADAQSVADLADETMNRFGQVDMLCNNAGVGPAGRVAETTLEDWRWMLGVNLWGVIHGVHAFLPFLRQAERAFILNTASLSGLTALPGRGAYSTAKFGVVALTEVLAAELALDAMPVTASVLCLGPTRTNIASGSRMRPCHLTQSGLRDFDLATGAGVLQQNEVRYFEPRDVAELSFAAMLRGDLYIQTHPELFGRIADRHEAIEASFDRARV